MISESILVFYLAKVGKWYADIWPVNNTATTDTLSSPKVYKIPLDSKGSIVLQHQPSR